MPDKYEGKYLKLWTPATYRIEVEGCLDESVADCLGSIRISTRKRADLSMVTVLTGRVRDQAELSGVINSLYQLYFPDLSVENIPEDNGVNG